MNISWDQHLKILYSGHRPNHQHSAGNGLPPALQVRISQFKTARDRNARTAAYTLLHQIVTNWTGDPLVLNGLEYTPLGRPFLPAFPRIDFNLSHSGDYAVCAAIVDGKVGIDIEQITTIDIADCSSAFSHSAWKDILESNDPQRNFYRAWTRMEAVAKAEGFGLGGPVQSIQFEMNRARFGDRQWHLLEIPISNDYSCHVASSRPISLADVQHVDAGQGLST